MTPLDRDLLIRTVASEAGGQGDAGMAAVANVIKNRLATGKWGKSYGDVVFSHSQFEPWGRGGRSNDPFELETSDAKYQAAARVVAQMESGKLADTSNGGTHFMNTAAVRDRNGGSLGSAGAWAKNQTAQIGDHTFYAPDGRVEAAPATAPPASAPAATKPSGLLPFAPDQSAGPAAPRTTIASVLGTLLGAAPRQAGETTRTPPAAGEDPLDGLAGIVPSAPASTLAPATDLQKPAPNMQADMREPAPMSIFATSKAGAKINMPPDPTVNTPEESANSYFSRISPEQRGPNPLQQLATLFGVPA